MTLIATEGSPGEWAGTNIYFSPVGESPSGKTKLWNVHNTAGPYLGEVKWFARWRKYSFNPTRNACVFEEVCLREIAEFIEERTKEQRTGL